MVFSQMLQGFGLDIVDHEMLERLRELTAIYQKNRWNSALQNGQKIFKEIHTNMRY